MLYEIAKGKCKMKNLNIKEVQLKFIERMFCLSREEILRICEILLVDMNYKDSEQAKEIVSILLSEEYDLSLAEISDICLFLNNGNIDEMETDIILNLEIYLMIKSLEDLLYNVFDEMLENDGDEQDETLNFLSYVIDKALNMYLSDVDLFNLSKSYDGMDLYRLESMVKDMEHIEKDFINEDDYLNNFIKQEVADLGLTLKEVEEAEEEIEEVMNDFVNNIMNRKIIEELNLKIENTNLTGKTYILPKKDLNVEIKHIEMDSNLSLEDIKEKVSELHSIICLHLSLYENIKEYEEEMSDVLNINTFTSVNDLDISYDGNNYIYKMSSLDSYLYIKNYVQRKKDKFSSIIYLESERIILLKLKENLL